MIILLLVGSYLLGNVLTGSIISKLFYKKEIRAEGSGNPGARNAGRLYGKKAFIITFLGDAVKGIIAVLVARLIGLGPEIELLALFAVVLGHVYPVLFKFHGGKGISTFIGGFLLFNPLVFAVFIGVFLILYPFIKKLHDCWDFCNPVVPHYFDCVFIQKSICYRSVFTMWAYPICAPRKPKREYFSKKGVVQ